MRRVPRVRYGQDRSRGYAHVALTETGIAMERSDPAMKTIEKVGWSRDGVDPGRRHLLRTTAMMAGAAHSALLGAATQRESRELAALGRAREWLNGSPLTPAGLAGKLVLVQFCTYTCINWLRTLPYVRAWSQRHRNDLLVIGVHTPEFPFEHDVDNVRRALRQLNVEYRVVLDNDYAIWRAFGNNYWPALYVIDGRGRVRDRHFGEGRYEQSERSIQRLLTEAGLPSARDVVSVNGHGVEAAADWANLRSPENYLGYERTANFASPGDLARDRRQIYAAPRRWSLNQWALAGDWSVGKQKATAASANSQILYRYHARDVHLVMGPGLPDTRVRFRVTVDQRPPGLARGTDVDESGMGVVVEPRLYQLIREPSRIVDRTFAIEFLDPGVDAFAFTFG